MNNNHYTIWTGVIQKEEVVENLKEELGRTSPKEIDKISTLTKEIYKYSQTIEEEKQKATILLRYTFE